MPIATSSVDFPESARSVFDYPIFPLMNSWSFSICRSDHRLSSFNPVHLSSILTILLCYKVKVLVKRNEACSRDEFLSISWGARPTLIR